MLRPLVSQVVPGDGIATFHSRCAPGDENNIDKDQQRKMSRMLILQNAISKERDFILDNFCNRSYISGGI